MSLPFEKPNPTLLRELRAVARRAGDLERALDETNILPDDFPRADVKALIVTLKALLDGTAEGCKEPLRFTEDRLAEIVRDHIQIEDDEEGAALSDDVPENPDAPPALARGGRLEQSASLLISAITIARSEYNRQAGEIEEDEPPERSVTPNAEQAATLGELGLKATEIQAEARDFQKKLDNPKHFNATDAVDDLKRQGRDAETILGVLRQSTGLATVKPAVMARLGQVLARIPDAVLVTWRGMRLAVDLTELGIKHFSDFATEQLLLPFKHMRKFADDIECRIEELAQPKSIPGQSTTIERQTDTAEHLKEWTPGQIFRDVDEPWCPEMVVIPAGSFMMGSLESEKEVRAREIPQHCVALAKPFALGRYPVTLDEIKYFCRESGHVMTDVGILADSRMPAINITFADAEAYLAWLSEITGHRYRLPSEAEWEYACRAGTTTPFWTGEKLSAQQANCISFGMKGKTQNKPTRVDMFGANPFGLHDMHGNIWEWCADDWHESYSRAPTNGSAWLGGDNSDWGVMRGGSWSDGPNRCRSAFRVVGRRGQAYQHTGFRAARTLD